MSWQRQEKIVACKICGRRMPGSGNKWHSPGDVKNKWFLVSCKQTDKSVFSFKVADWKKILKEALFEGKVPVMAVEISGELFWIFHDKNVINKNGKFYITRD